MKSKALGCSSAHARKKGSLVRILPPTYQFLKKRLSWLYLKKLCILFAANGLMKNYIIEMVGEHMVGRGVSYMHLKNFIFKIAIRSMAD